MSVEPSRTAMPYACWAFTTALWRIVTCCVPIVAGQWPSWKASHWFVLERFEILTFSITAYELVPSIQSIA